MNVARKKRYVWIVWERFQSDYSDEYDQESIFGIHSTRLRAQAEKRDAIAYASEERQDYKYDVTRHEVDEDGHP